MMKQGMKTADANTLNAVEVVNSDLLEGAFG
jgi:hypothetical protein